MCKFVDNNIMLSLSLYVADIVLIICIEKIYVHTIYILYQSNVNIIVSIHLNILTKYGYYYLHFKWCEIVVCQSMLIYICPFKVFDILSLPIKTK
jgi:hypothetical protein